MTPSNLTSLAAAVLILAATAAGAAAQTATPPAFTWSGLYVGVHAGYGEMRPHYSEPDFPLAGLNPTMRGGVFGIYTGFNHQIGRVVLGIEADVGFGAVKRNNDRANPGNGYTAFKSDVAAHVRARAGYAIGRALPFVAGGLALADFTVRDTDPGCSRRTTTRVGWSVGGGLDYALTDNLVVRAEYVHDRYGRSTGTLHCAEFGPYTVTSRPTANTARLGLSLRF